MGSTNRKEFFDYDFERFKQDYPDWDKYLTDSTYFWLMDWYDATYHLGSEDENSIEARDFANYVWERIREKEQKREMMICESGHGGSFYYNLQNMTRDDMYALLTMIKGTGLQERRVFERVKRQIEKILEA